MGNTQFMMVLAIEFCFQMGSFTINPIISSYVVAIGGAVVAGGFIAGLNSVSALLSRPFVGMGVDGFDLLKLLLGAGVLSCFSSFCSAVFQNVCIVAVCRVVFGVAFAFKSTVIVALARLSLPEERVASGLSYVSLLYVLANALGPLVGTEIGMRWGYQACFLVSAAFFLGALIAAKGILRGRGELASGKADSAESAPRKKPAFVVSFSDSIYRPVLKATAMAGMVSFTLGSTNALLVLALTSRGVRGVSLFFLVSALVMLASRLLAGRICDRYGFLPAFIPASIFAVLSMVCLACAQSLATVLLAAAFFAAGQCTLSVLIQSDSMRRVPKEYVGRASNTLFYGPDIGMFLGPTVGGAVLQMAGDSALFALNAIVVSLVALFYFAFVRR